MQGGEERGGSSTPSLLNKVWETWILVAGLPWTMELRTTRNISLSISEVLFYLEILGLAFLCLVKLPFFCECILSMSSFAMRLCFELFFCKQQNHNSSWCKQQRWFLMLCKERAMLKHVLRLFSVSVFCLADSQSSSLSGSIALSLLAPLLCWQGTHFQIHTNMPATQAK